MKHKIKKWHIALMSFMALFIAVFASLFSLRADTVDEETGEILTDNWKFDIVFYDSSVDNGKTPLTEINWDASDGTYGAGSARTIIVQINYDNSNISQTFNEGELQISIPNLAYGKKIGSGSDYEFIGFAVAQTDTVITLGANDDTHINYNWTLSSATNPSTDQETFTFTNTGIINENTNFEGSIQIAYNIIPGAESADGIGWGERKIEAAQNECIHSYATSIQANLTTTKENVNLKVSSNILEFSYTRTYYHPWTKDSYGISKTASKINSFDGMPNNASDYYWVKYTFTTSGYLYTSYPLLRATKLKVKDELPNGCIALDENLNELSIINNIVEVEPTRRQYANQQKAYLYIGYPKSTYKEELGNLNITNVGDLYGLYPNSEEYEYLTKDDVSINLAEFDFKYSGELYGITKTYMNSGLHYSKLMLDEDFIHCCYGGVADECYVHNHASTGFIWNYTALATYTGTPLTVKVGDDLLFITDSNGNYRKLNDDEYWFTRISLPYIYNLNNILIPYNKYETTLYVRYAGDSEYTLYTNLADYSAGTDITFSADKKVVGFYIEVEDMSESLHIIPEINDLTKYARDIYLMIKPKNNISAEGTIYNFNFIQAFFKDENGNLLLQNAAELEDYSTFTTKELIAAYDQTTYNTYVQRSTAYTNYTEYSEPTLNFYTKAYKLMNTATQDNENEIFTIRSNIGFYICGTRETEGLSASYNNASNQTYIDNVFFEHPENLNLISKYQVYDLLPQGMKLISTPAEMLNSLTSMGENGNSYYPYFFDKNGNKMFSNYSQLAQFIKEHSTINIIDNYNNTGRTKIEWLIDCSDDPFIYIGNRNYGTRLSINIDCQLSFDNYLEYGKDYDNYVYLTGQHLNNTSMSYNTSTTDNGYFDLASADINNNSILDEKIAYKKSSISITSVISTHQDVTTYVQTDQSNYSTGIVDASCNSEYEYKLRVRTGSADVTNLVIYTSIEEAQPKRTRWYGEFLDVDTTYAENKGYTVKVWYSPNKTVGTLTEDTSWQVYDESTVDKSKVKSLAFQYLIETDDTTGTSIDAIDPAVLPANSLTYVLIKMKAPNDESIKTLARMDCWTQWNAIDEFDQPVDFITGINSNVVKVALPNSIKADDLPSISLKFAKEIQGETANFENLKINKADEHIFMIRLTSLTANDDGTYNQVTGLLSSTQELVITQIPIGTYLLEELGDNYFDFVEFTNNNDPEIIIEGVTFEKTDQGYIITVSEDLTENIEFNIKVTNQIEPDRFYEDKHSKENLFLKSKLESAENDPA